MKLYVLLSTIDERLAGVPNVLRPQEEGVRYVVSWQQTKDEAVMEGPVKETLTWLGGRTDVAVTLLKGRGLCRNRNHAVEYALAWMDDPLEDAVFVIADDDEVFCEDAFKHIRAVYGRYPKLDGALFRLRSRLDGQYFKDYPAEAVAYGRHPRSYYACSWEMTFRARVWQTGIRFNEHFGLGSESLCAGEEEVLLTDVVRKGLHVLIVPEDIGSTEPVTTGSHELDAKVLRSKGAVYSYKMSGMPAFVRSAREALALGLKYRKNPWRLFVTIWSGRNHK
ncbi:MAG: hypothetical protein K6A32_06750 [Bacteroidales bacterium]|nr:hypothetical protein [Bacteroidales bacterium]